MCRGVAGVQCVEMMLCRGDAIDEDVEVMLVCSV